MDMMSKSHKQKAAQLCREMLSILISGVNPDGSFGDGDADVLTHHFLLTLDAWPNQSFSKLRNRSIQWFNELDQKDIREVNEKQFNPFKLYAFTYLNDKSMKPYIENKMEVLRKYHTTSSGYAVLQLGFIPSGDVHAVFPTLMAADLLIKDGTDESIALAGRSIDWAFNEIVQEAVYENLSSILGFAALVGTKYFTKTGKNNYQDVVEKFIDRLMQIQKKGLWEEDPYQSAFIFFDLAYIASYNSNPKIIKLIHNFLEMALGPEFFQHKKIGGQIAILVFNTLLRGFAMLLSTYMKKNIIRRVIDAAFAASGEFKRKKEFIDIHHKGLSKYFQDLKNNRLISVNPAIFNEREFDTKKDRVFVLMPYGNKKWYTVDKDTKQLRTEKYNFDKPFRMIIAPTIESMGLNCKRADSIFATIPFMEKIWCQINESLLIIADLTSSNPNVLYELGVAHTLGKPIIMMTQDECYVPTDLKAIDYIRYDRDIGSEEELQKQLKKAITHTITGER